MLFTDMGKNTGGSTRKEAMGVNVRAEIQASLTFKFDQIGTGLFNINISLISSETEIISINNKKVHVWVYSRGPVHSSVVFWKNS